jgi:hypothetical protein
MVDCVFFDALLNPQFWRGALGRFETRANKIAGAPSSYQLGWKLLKGSKKSQGLSLFRNNFHEICWSKEEKFAKPDIPMGFCLT